MKPVSISQVRSHRFPERRAVMKLLKWGPLPDPVRSIGSADSSTVCEQGPGSFFLP